MGLFDIGATTLSALSVNSPPTDWTIAITYSGGGLSSPQGVVIDQVGNVWVANSGNSSVPEFNSTGAAVSPATGFTAGGISLPYALALDRSNSVWIANSGNNSLTKLSSSGPVGTNYPGNGALSALKGIAIDGAGDIFLTNRTASSVAGFSNTGTAFSGSPFSGGGVATPTTLAISPKEPG